MAAKINPYKLRPNATCPKCGDPAEKHVYPARKNHGREYISYIHEVRPGMFGMREIVRAHDVRETEA